VGTTDPCPPSGVTLVEKKKKDRDRKPLLEGHGIEFARGPAPARDVSMKAEETAKREEQGLAKGQRNEGENDGSKYGGS